MLNTDPSQHATHERCAACSPLGNDRVRLPTGLSFETFLRHNQASENCPESGNRRAPAAAAVEREAPEFVRASHSRRVRCDVSSDYPGTNRLSQRPHTSTVGDDHCAGHWAW